MSDNSFASFPKEFLLYDEIFHGAEVSVEFRCSEGGPEVNVLHVYHGALHTTENTDLLWSMIFCSLDPTWKEDCYIL